MGLKFKVRSENSNLSWSFVKRASIRKIIHEFDQLIPKGCNESRIVSKP
jgi:hypothetical protein